MANTKQQLICSRSVGEHIAQIGASPFNDKEPYCGNQVSTKLTMPTNAPRVLLGLISPLLARIWRDGHCYQKGGVTLADFTAIGIQQDDRFTSEQQGPRSNVLMLVIDKIHQGSLGKVYFGARGAMPVNG